MTSRGLNSAQDRPVWGGLVCRVAVWSGSGPGEELAACAESPWVLVSTGWEVEEGGLSE